MVVVLVSFFPGGLAEGQVLEEGGDEVGNDFDDDQGVVPLLR